MPKDRPIIAIPTAEIVTKPNEPSLWAMRSSYATPLIKAGATPVFFPQFQALEEIEPILRTVDGLLLAGGADIDPDLYHAEAQEKLEEIDKARDRSEFAITKWAIERKLPLLGICRGMQMINVVAGGTLYQDLPSDLDLPIPHRIQPTTYASLDHNGHLIRLEGDSRLCAIVGQSEVWMNSMHHQAVKKLGMGLKVVGRSADELVEAIEAEDSGHWLVAVQGHPEAMTRNNPWVEKMFSQFVKEAERYHAAHG